MSDSTDSAVAQQGVFWIDNRVCHRCQTVNTLIFVCFFDTGFLTKKRNIYIYICIYVYIYICIYIYNYVYI